MTQHFVPGNFVRHAGRPDWGLGQIQSVVHNRATVNFENAGKQTILLAAATLVPADPADPVDDNPS